MAWSGGVFTRVHNWVNDYNAAIDILPDRHDAEDDNLATGINACVNKDGSNAFTGDIDAGSNQVTNVAAGSAATDAATIGGAETLTNKTLTSPVLTTPQINDTSADHQYIFAVSELIADRTITLPLLTGNDDFVFEDHTQTLTNKTLDNSTTLNIKGAYLTIEDLSNSTKTASFDFTVGTADTNTKLMFTQSADRTITVPDITDTLVTKQTTDTLTNKTIDSASNTLTVDLGEATVTGSLAEFNTALQSENFRTSGDEYATSGSTASLATNATEDVSVTHGLGTDDVIVEVVAKGNASAIYSWNATIVLPSGYCTNVNSDPTISLSYPSAPSTGNVTVRFKNWDSTTTIDYRILVRKRSV